MRVLLDTNVLVSAILFGGVSRSILERGITGEIDLVTSPSLTDEFEGVVGEKFPLPPEIARAVRSELELLADVVRPKTVPPVLHDPDDEVLATATTGQAEVIVTGDRRLLGLGSHRNIRIVTPRDFLTFLGRP